MRQQIRSHLSILLVFATLFLLLLSTQPIAIAAPPSRPVSAPGITAAEIDTYLAGKGSPLAGLGQGFVDQGRDFDVDPRLLVAIAGAESSFGKHLCTDYNAWNWFYSGWCSSPFAAWSDGIYWVTRGLRLYYLDQGRTTLEAIRDKYCPGCTNWLTNVTIFYHDELGGDLNDLTFQGAGGGGSGEVISSGCMAQKGLFQQHITDLGLELVKVLVFQVFRDVSRPVWASSRCTAVGMNACSTR